jgi:hypothetical protein
MVINDQKSRILPVFIRILYDNDNKEHIVSLILYMIGEGKYVQNRCAFDTSTQSTIIFLIC